MEISEKRMIHEREIERERKKEKGRRRRYFKVTY